MIGPISIEKSLAISKIEIVRFFEWYYDTVEMAYYFPLQLNHIVCNPIIQKFGLFNHFQGIHMANIFRIFGLEKNTHNAWWTSN